MGQELVTGSQGFSWADYLQKLNLPPTAGLTQPGEVLPSEWESSWISKSEQEKARDIAALMLQIPRMPLTTFQTIALNFPKIFSIANVAAAQGEWKSFGATETGITLAAAFVWAQQQGQQSNLVQLLLGSTEKNPLELGLTQFVKDAQIGPVDAQAMQLLLRTMAVPAAVVRTVSPDLVLRAFSIAEQQLILSILDKWIESQAAMAEAQREEARVREIKMQQAALQLLREYYAKVTGKEEVLAQSTLATLMGALMTNDVSLTAAVMASPFVAGIVGAANPVPLLANIPSSIQAQMGALSLGVVAASTAWATPVAMALIGTSGFSSHQASLDAAKAYAVTLSAFLMERPFEDLVKSTLESARSSGLIDGSQVKLVTAAFRISLLINAMAALYRAEYGGVTGKELLGLLNGSVPVEKENFLSTLITLVNDSIQGLPKGVAESLIAQLVANYDHELQLSSITEPISSFLEVWSQNLGPEASASAKA